MRRGTPFEKNPQNFLCSTFFKSQENYQTGANFSKLLSFYTYRHKRNSVFPLARGGDLRSLLQNRTRPPHFEHDFAFHCALCGLTSGLENIHSYTLEKSVQIKLIGLHQDLKHSTILVDAGRFIIADFSVSEFKNGSQTSKTPFRIGGGDHLRPESEDLSHEI